MSEPLMLWYGWGEHSGGHAVSEDRLAVLGRELGLSGRRTPPVSLASVVVPASTLGDDVAAALADAVGGSSWVRSSDEERVRHAAGRSYPDLIRLRSGSSLAPPDAVVYPESHDSVAAVLELCAERGIAVVPFGGGTKC